MTPPRRRSWAVGRVHARSLGAQAVRVRIGFGPVVHRSAGAMRLTELRTPPLSFFADYLPRRETHGRDQAP